jgi:hypothetical protein
MQVFSFYSAKVIAEVPLSFLLVSILGLVTSYLTHSESLVACFMNPLPHVYFVLLVGLLWQVGSALGLLLGVVMPSVDSALEIGKVITMVTIIFGGLYFDVSTLPWFLQLLPLMSPVKICWEGLVVNEFQYLEFDDDNSSNVRTKNFFVGGGKFATGLEVLFGLNLKSEDLFYSMIKLTLIALVLHASALVMLIVKSPRYALP